MYGAFEWIVLDLWRFINVLFITIIIIIIIYVNTVAE